MPQFDPNAPQRMWLERNGRKSVHPFAAVMTIVGIALGFVSIEFGGLVLRILSCVLFLAGVVFLHGFRLREIRKDGVDDPPGPGALF